MCAFFFMGIEYTSEALTSVKRIQEFLLLEELPPKAVIHQTGNSKGLVIKDMSAKWDKELPQMTLKNISLILNPGELLAVVGPVGAGKSSLLMSILKELPVLSGQVNVHGTMSYVAQQPWIFSASLRQNILFGQKYDKIKYKQIVQVCALKRDIELLPHKEQQWLVSPFTQVFPSCLLSIKHSPHFCDLLYEIKPSSFCNHLYPKILTCSLAPPPIKKSSSQIFLLYIPTKILASSYANCFLTQTFSLKLSLYVQCINGYLKEKSRILVTHQLQFLPQVNRIIILDQGEAVGIGTFEELLESGIDFASLLKRPNKEEEQEAPTRAASVLDMVEMSPSVTNLQDQVGSLVSLCSVGNEFKEEVHIQEEGRKIGHIGLYVYLQYFKAGAHFLYGILMGLVFIVSTLFYIGTDYWVARWSNQEQSRYEALQKQKAIISEGYNFTNTTIPTTDFSYNTAIYSGLTLGVFAFSLLKAFMFYWNSIQTSQTLHNTMYTNIIRAKIAFFDENPAGRILNRFSKDMGLIDDILPANGMDFLQCFFLTMSVVFVTGFVNPWIFIPTFFMVCLFIFLRQYYVRTSRSVKRLETVARSPVFSQINASLQGLSSIRAFNAQERFLEEFDNFQDIHTEAWFLFIAITRWLALRLDLLCTAFVSSVIMGSIPLSSELDAGIVGLSVTYSFILTGMFQWFIRQSVEVENNIVSVERVLEYGKLPKEASLESEDSKQPKQVWPEHGNIVAKNLSLKYYEDGPLVLKNINFAIKSQEKVGIAGRTGAGKSSLIIAMFRMVEPQGQLIIDNIDSKSIGLHDLRSKLSIIPQDPVLFKGTLRKNLDPFKEYQDEDLWRALEEVQMKDVISELPKGLESQVNEGGDNYSVGQRQLICLGRAILRQNKILIIDEATANVDVGTDALIQKTIREKFKHCTVLTIAHRLVTIMDSDRVLVLDNGEIMEFDSPHNLLQDTKGYFYKMVHQGDSSEIEYLTSIAWQAAQRQKEFSSNKTHEPVTHLLQQSDKDLTTSVASLTI
ncbi:ABCC4 [Acanthosepion pharaonis]|uniref:ABCC4 n=1 Tax=Acanthosepion pharaonis TaxID=158019 RepID=A0A812D1J8_ACAPH|nr:ABCC4 [Sepia pharaonis]